MSRGGGGITTVPGVSFGSDWAAASYFADYRPLNPIQIATTRQPIGRPDVPSRGGPEARVSLDVAIRANALGAETDVYEISQAPVRLTMMNSVVRHREGT